MLEMELDLALEAGADFMLDPDLYDAARKCTHR
jgi:hypothetical protein